MSSQWSLKSNTKSHIINFNWLLFYTSVFTKLTNQLLYTPTLLKFSNTTHLLNLLFSQKNPLSTKRHSLQKPTLDRRTRYNSKFLKTTQLKIQRNASVTFDNCYNKSLFELYLQFTQISPTTFFKPHGNFVPFFITNLTGKATFVNIAKTYSRWLQFNQLLDNLFLNELKCFIFSVKPFRQECTAFNWTEKCFDYELFRKSTPYFFKKDIQFGSDSITIFNRFERAGLATAFVTDSQYHWKNLYYLRRVGVYTISPIALNNNPWDVHFSLPVSSNNLISQYFFVKLLTAKKHQAKVAKFQTLRKSWF